MNRTGNTIGLLFLLISFSLSVLAAEQLYSHKPSRMPELAKAGESDVGVNTIKVVNKNQLNMQDFSSTIDRELLLEVWYPAKVDEQSKAVYEDVTRTGVAFAVQGEAYRDAEVLEGGSYPLVVLSHGYTGYRTIMFYLGEHLASHGYIVVGIDHTDSTNADIDFSNAPFAGFPSTLVNRARDQQFVLDYFTKEKTQFSAVVNTDEASVIGYSMGGYGAINTVGGCYQFNQAGLQALGFPEEAAGNLVPVFSFCNAGREKADSRWKAMVAFAPWGQERMLHSPESLAKINAATLYVSGDHDDISGYEQGVKRLFEQTNPKDNYLLTYREGRHNIAPHPAPTAAHANDIDLGHYEEPAWSSEVLNQFNAHFTLAFLNCYVKKQQAGCDYLPERENINQLKQADGKLTPPWPGIPDRWGVGVSFTRPTLKD